MNACPCEICVVRPMCQKRQIWDLLDECPNFYDFLVATTPDHYDRRWVFYEDSLFLACEVLNIGLRKGTFHEQNMSVYEPINNSICVEKL